MRTLLAALGDPQLAYPAIHVVGTNGKSTATLTIEALLRAEGLSVGSTISPHIRGWAERIRVDGEPADFEAAVARVRPEAEAQETTQFETVCAAAFAEFAARGVDVAVVEAGLGGRLDATNVLRSHVVLLTSVGLEHTDVLGDTREQIAAEKLAVVQEGTIAVLPDEEFAHLAGPNVVVGGAREAAEAFLGRRLEHEVEISLPGRLERRGEEVWDGAHNPDGVAWLVRQLAPCGLRAVRLGAARQGCVRDARAISPCSAARSSRRSPRTPACCRPRSSHVSPSRTSPRSRSSPIPSRRSPAHASMGRCS